jgi:glycerol-3-phosphate dehydrogenase (NAD(P)+)
MTEKDFWRKSRVAVLGGGNWGTVLAHLASQNCGEVRLWVRTEEQARSINANRVNQDYVPELPLAANIKACCEPERIFEGGMQAVIWALPSSVARPEARHLAPYFAGDEVVIHATKGVEEGTLKRISTILREELPCARIGVLSGPNLAHEVARGEPAATVIASHFPEVVSAGTTLMTTDRFRVYGAEDVVGVEWAGTLKNVLAIASGALDAMKLGWNARAMLLTRGLAEIVRFGVALGGEQSTFLGLAGMGDLLATCSSPLSRNYRVGMRLAQGQKLSEILKELGSTAEGVKTSRSVHEYARTRNIEMPITEGVYQLLTTEVSVQEILHSLMTRPSRREA